MSRLHRDILDAMAPAAARRRRWSRSATQAGTPASSKTRSRRTRGSPHRATSESLFDDALRAALARGRRLLGIDLTTISPTRDMPDGGRTRTCLAATDPRLRLRNPPHRRRGRRHARRARPADVLDARLRAAACPMARDRQGLRRELAPVAAARRRAPQYGRLADSADRRRARVRGRARGRAIASPVAAGGRAPELRARPNAELRDARRAASSAAAPAAATST